MSGADDVGHIPELQRLKEISERLVSPELSVKIVEELPDALVVVRNDDGVIVLFNRQAELMFGYTRIEVIGQRIETLIPDEKREVHEEHRRRYSNDPRARPMGVAMALTARAKNGRTFPVQINLSPIPTIDGTFTSAIVRRTDT